MYFSSRLIRRGAISSGVLLFTLLLCFFCFALYLSRTEKSFPDLPARPFVGALSGFGSTPVTLYVEAIQDSDLYLVVLFTDNFTPQLISRNKPSSAAQSKLRGLPLVISHQGMNYILTGTRTEQGYAGEWQASAGKRGRWEIRPQNPVTISNERSNSVGDPKFTELLSLLSQLETLRLTLNAQQQRYQNLVDQAARLRNFLERESLLKTRAEEKQKEMSAQYLSASKLQEQLQAQVKLLLTELDLQSKINRRGQGVRLARRIAASENRFYLANWSVEDDSEELLRSISFSATREFEKNFLEASAKKQILEQIEFEERKIQELQLATNPATPADITPEVETQSAKPAEKKNQSFWRTLWE
ncbi:hypothetical protein JNK13_02380 [bacterium]|nr:hypothetical protein [bacterium]